MNVSDLNQYINELRKRYNIGTYPDKIERVCNEVATDCFVLATKFKLFYEMIDLKELGIVEPFHRASLLGFPQNKEIKWYLIDPTYGQFFENETFKRFMSEKYENISNELLSKGYIEASYLNLLKYINGFISSKAFNQNINLDVLNQFNEILEKNGIKEKTPELN